MLWTSQQFLPALMSPEFWRANLKKRHSIATLPATSRKLPSKHPPLPGCLQEFSPAFPLSSWSFPPRCAGANFPLSKVLFFGAPKKRGNKNNRTWIFFCCFHFSRKWDVPKMSQTLSWPFMTTPRSPGWLISCLPLWTPNKRPSLGTHLTTTSFAERVFFWLKKKHPRKNFERVHQHHAGLVVAFWCSCCGRWWICKSKLLPKASKTTRSKTPPLKLRCFRSLRRKTTSFQWWYWLVLREFLHWAMAFFPHWTRQSYHNPVTLS